MIRYLKIGVLSICISSLMLLGGCRSKDKVIVAKYPGGQVTQRELEHVMKTQNIKGSVQKSPALRKKLMADTARQIGLVKYIQLRSHAIEQSEEAKNELDLMALEAAANKWDRGVLEAVTREIPARDVQDYLQKHMKALKNPGGVSYYFLYLKTQGLQGKQLEDKKAKAAQLAKQGQADPKEFANIVKMNTEADDPRSANLIGPVDRDTLPDYLADILFEKLQENQVSEPVEIPNGIAVFQVAVRMTDPSPDAISLQKMARDRLVFDRYNRRVQQDMDSLRKKYPVENHWFDKDYGQWKDSDIVYSAGPIKRTFKQMKTWAPRQESMMCMTKSAETIELFIRRDLAMLGGTNGTGDYMKFLTDADREKGLRRVLFLKEALKSKKIMDEGIQKVLTQAKLNPESMPASADDFAKIVYTGFGSMLDIGAPAWYQIEKVGVEPRAEALKKQRSIPAVQGVEKSKEVAELLQKGADPKKADELLPPDSSFRAVYYPPTKENEKGLPGQTAKVLDNLPDKTWSAPILYANDIIICRVLSRRGAMTIPFNAAKAEFVPAFKQYLVLSGIDKVKSNLMREIQVFPENLPKN